MYSKTQIFNLALSALFLQKTIADSETDTSKEAVQLRLNWNAAFNMALEKLDLDSTAIIDDLELIDEEPNLNWKYAYRYPTNCAFFRRIVTAVQTDDEDQILDRQIGYHGTDKVIYTDEASAQGEWIKNDINPAHLSVEAAMVVAYELARMCMPFLVGKDSANVRKTIDERYMENLLNAWEKESKETHIRQPEWKQSGFAKARLS